LRVGQTVDRVKQETEKKEGCWETLWESQSFGTRLIELLNGR